MRGLLVAVAAVLWIGCGSEPGPARGRLGEADAAPAASTREATGPPIIAFGDSLTAGYGVAPESSYPARLQQELDRRGLEYRIVNEGVSGDTTAVALARVDLAASHQDAVLAIIAIGANDGLRGLPIEQMESNLRAIIESFQAVGVEVALAGMRLPPNFGPDYVAAFESVYPRLALELDVPLMPFLLDGVAADAGLNQDDGIHPNEQGNVIVAEAVADFIEPLLERSAEAAE